ncbi:hypothetical protein JB92DRAFT_3129339 [Gautieria morchelliformis]|nr:hypothetical protein JB92DRAFT_3129339 [Gautieria morchelliformis]
MEDIASQPSCSASKHVKRIRPDVKKCLEKWYAAMGKPKAVTLGEILHEIKSRIDPVGITLRQLNRWFSQRRRRLEGAPVTLPHRRIAGLSAVFPTLTNTELDHLKILVGENPDPSPELLTVWVQSPLLANVTLEDAHRFVKYHQVQMQSDHNTSLQSPSKCAIHQDAPTGDADESDEEDTLDDESYLTPEFLSPVLKPHSLKPEPCISPKLHPGAYNQIRGPPPRSSSETWQLPRDRRALLGLLQSQLSPGELKALLQEGINHVNSVPSTPNVEPFVFDNLPRPEDQPLSPISPLLHKSSRLFVHTHLSSPGEISFSSNFTKELARTVSADSSSHQTHMPYSLITPTVISPPGFLPKKILVDISKLSRTATVDRTTPENAIKRFKLCKERSEELLAALERGLLRNFGMVPNKELKDLGLPDLPKGFM